MKGALVFFFCMIMLKTYSQEDFFWWTEKHNWDGHTSWVQYMTMSTSFMGPNALPVPEVKNGTIDSSAELEVAGDYHFSKGEKTKDFFLRGYLPLYKNRIAVSLEAIPYEWFATDTITRDVRAARTRSGKGGAGGDIYFSTDFQLIAGKKNFPDVLFRAAFRTASGTNLRNARYTDGPGYFFDLSAGKNFLAGKSTWRVFLMSGFYVYQTFDLEHLQNDCILYGCGVEAYFSKIVFSQTLAGYNGYLQIGDKPLVCRTSLRIKQKLIDWKISYQWGINDYDFQRIRAGLIFHFNPDIK